MTAFGDMMTLSPDVVYRELRHEMTSIFTSIKRLVMGQFAFLLALMAVFLQADNIITALCVGLVLTLIPYVVCFLGTIWFESSIRVGNYLFLTYEMKDLDENPDSDRRHLWLLANRSESRLSENKIFKNHYYMTQGIESFLKVQRAILIIILLSFILNIFRIYFANYIVAKIIFISFISLSILISFCFSFGFVSEALKKDIPITSMQSWQNYLLKRPLPALVWVPPRCCGSEVSLLHAVSALG
jgi:hypothetical protein